MNTEVATGFVLVSIGNTRTRVGVVRHGEMDASQVYVNTDCAACVTGVTDAVERGREGHDAVVVVLASVEPTHAEAVLRGVREAITEPVHVLGHDVPLDVQHTLRDASTLGVDRVLNAVGAWTQMHEAAVVIDAGTAVTVDFVDGEGVFHGGAIAPGAGAMLAGLHAAAPALPALTFDPAMVPKDEGEPFGGDTAEAMQFGVVSAIRGLLREQLDRYAERYGAYPRVIATGGDAVALFEYEGSLVDRIVPDLTLVGMRAMWDKYFESLMSDDGDEDDAVVSGAEGDQDG